MRALGLHRVAYFYAGMFVVALGVGAVFDVHVFSHTHQTPWEALSWLATGVLLGLLTALVSMAASRSSAAVRRLDAALARSIGPVDTQEALLMAALSGLAEEALFRGALQPLLGLWLTSVLFMVAHLPPNRALVPWTLTAGVLGLLLGLTAQVSGSILCAVGAHFTLNAINLRRLGKLAQELDGTPG
jgi:membrane protease YdiL (CAAX protease family)